MNIMEVIEKDDLRVKKVPFIDRNLWKEVLQKMLNVRSREYPNLSICDECVRDCPQVEAPGLFRFYCGNKGLEWKR